MTTTMFVTIEATITERGCGHISGAGREKHRCPGGSTAESFPGVGKRKRWRGWAFLIA
jgi:hypothetical protein